MKKIFALLLSLTLVVGLLTACGSKKDETTTEPTVAPTAAPAATTAPAATAAPAATTDATATAKTGVAVITALDKSTPAGDKDGLAEVDSTIVAVLVGQDGKILKCSIDAEQTKVNFSKEGKITSDVTAAADSKQGLKEQYGLKSASKIGKEWYEQANAFAAYVVGKTADEVKGIAVSDQGTAADADLSASVTIHIGDFINGVTKAVANAQDLGASATDKLGLGISTTTADSKDVAADADGVAQTTAYVTALTTNADGKITSCAIDAAQSKVNFDAKGAITTDLTVAPQTKQELKENYGMKKASKIGKEWYEQANAFAAYVTGKTVADVDGIAVNEEGAATAADLTSSVTIGIGSFISSVDEAVANAQ